MVLLVDKSNKKYCYEPIECYNMTGDRLGLATINPKDKMSWMNYKDDNKLILEIIKLTPELGASASIVLAYLQSYKV